MENLATDRIKEIYAEIKAKTDWRVRNETDMEILAIKRYLDEKERKS